MSNTYYVPVIIDPFPGFVNFIAFFILNGVALNAVGRFFNGFIKFRKGCFGCFIIGYKVNRQHAIVIVFKIAPDLLFTLFYAFCGIIVTVKPGRKVMITSVNKGVLVCFTPKKHNSKRKTKKYVFNNMFQKEYAKIR